MTTKVVEVLTKILDGLNKNNSLEHLNSEISRENRFDKPTISAAFSLVYDKILNNVNSESEEEKNKNIRLLSEEEIEKIGVEYYDYLIHLQNIGLMSPSEIESLLEQIMFLPNESLTIEDINWMILVSLVDYNNKILPGSRITLYSSDNIN